MAGLPAGHHLLSFHHAFRHRFLLVCLAVVHAELWFGKGGVPRVSSLRSELRVQQKANAEATARNEQLAAEVRDLQEGLEMVEERPVQSSAWSSRTRSTSSSPASCRRLRHRPRCRPGPDRFASFFA